MVDVEKMIIEIGKYECIWNWINTHYGDRDAKREAWEKVAAEVYLQWEDQDEDAKMEKISELQRKWKSVKDYYRKEKKAEKQVWKSGTAAARKRKYHFSDILSFLDQTVEQTTRNVDFDENDLSHNNSDEEVINYSTPKTNEEAIDGSLMQKEDSISSIPLESTVKEPAERNKKLTAFQSELLRMLEEKHKQPQLDETFDADKSFLLSFLPEVQKMDEAQKIEFKIQMPLLIQQLKLRNCQQNEMCFISPHPAPYAIQMQQGNGSGGLVRDAAGESYVKMEAVSEEEYFKKLQREEISKLKGHLHEEVDHHEESIKKLEEEISRYKSKISELSKSEDSLCSNYLF